ncbi:MAG: hypothetical protein QME52_00640 [Bacteroidota bacterium]|nr:hypothetical protein [Bacteroidota bacterium]
MKKLILVFIAILIIGQLSYAGDVTAMTNEGDKALLFQFNGLSSLGASSYRSDTRTITYGSYTLTLPTVNGIGMKYYLSNDLALNGALLFGMKSKTTKAAIAGNADETESGMGFGLEAGIQSNMMKSGPFVAFIGAAANIIMYSGTYEWPNSGQPTKTNKIEGSLMEFGVAGLIGFDYFIYDRISLGAEYRLGLKTSSGTVDYTPAGVTTTSFDLPSEMTVGFSTISFTLAAYW